MTHRDCTLTRRDAVRILTCGVAYGLLVPETTRAVTQALVPLGTDRYASYPNSKGSTWIIEGVDFPLDQSSVPGTMNVIVRGDRVTLTGAIVLPGYSLSILARELICLPGASITTVGHTLGSDYTGGHANVGVDGSSFKAGIGGNGGDILIVVGSMTGSLQLDASGGKGGGAMSGGPGLSGKPGSPATEYSPGGNGTDGQLGGLAGVPGNGGNGGNISVGALNGSFLANTRSDAGPPGAVGTNGDSGAAGAAGLGKSGRHWIIGNDCLPPNAPR